jgi:hypothetical protein
MQLEDDTLQAPRLVPHARSSACRASLAQAAMHVVLTYREADKSNLMLEVLSSVLRNMSEEKEN